MIRPGSNQKSEIQYVLITDFEPLIRPFLPPMEIHPEVLNFVHRLPKDIVQLVETIITALTRMLSKQQLLVQGKQSLYTLYTDPLTSTSSTTKRLKSNPGGRSIKYTLLCSPFRGIAILMSATLISVIRCGL